MASVETKISSHYEEESVVLLLPAEINGRWPLSEDHCNQFEDYRPITKGYAIIFSLLKKISDDIKMFVNSFL